MEAEYSRWLCDLSHRVRHGLAQLWEIQQGGQLAAVMGIYGKNPSAGLVGTGFTAPPFRNRGYAGRLLHHCAAQLAKEGRLAAFCCYEQLVPFYQKLGFTRRGHVIRLI